jgi:hypothetical protein
MAKIDEQIANIGSMLQQILQQTEMPEDEDEDEGCPYCQADGYCGRPRGAMTVVMTKKKLKPGQMPEMPAVLKNVLKAMTEGR